MVVVAAMTVKLAPSRSLAFQTASITVVLPSSPESLSEDPKMGVVGRIAHPLTILSMN